MEKLNYYRCGWCGIRVTEDGAVIPREKADAMKVDWEGAQQVNGDCCRENEIERTPTAEMISDAGFYH